MDIYQAREILKKIKLLVSEKLTLEQQRKELQTQLKNANVEKSLLKKELELIQPMVERGFEPQIKGVQLQQKIAMVDSKIEQAEVSLPSIDLEKQRIDQQIKITKQKFMSRAKEEVETARADLANATMKQDQLSDRVARTEIKSPTDGIISKVEVNTIGEVVSPPCNSLKLYLIDELVIETELEVQDIISISLGQNARVSFSAYDPGIYGYLNASVEKIGIDTQQRDDGSYYYPVRVKTKSRKFDRGNKEAEFVPGMMASVEIIGEARNCAIHAVQI